jgi:glutamate synthase (NADPH/NADH) small chain
MAERLNNDFQFIEVGRKDPKKKLLRQRKKEFVEIYEPFKPAAVRGTGTPLPGLR